ncbi:MAG: cell wall hydrolase [Sphingobium sp.]
MSFRLNAAIAAAFSMSVVAALFVTDMSIASETASPVIIAKEYRDAVVVPEAGQKPVIFSKPSPVVQPIPADPVAAASQDFRTSTPQGDSQPATSLAALVDAHGAAEDVDGDMRCLAGAIYFESKGESLEGQLAVARVIINRARSGRFADSLCGVVYQRGQFSFVRGGSMPAIPLASRDWREAVAIAQIATAKSWNSQAEGALFFHARRVSPGWGKAKLALIDNHIFYR